MSAVSACVVFITSLSYGAACRWQPSRRRHAVSGPADGGHTRSGQLGGGCPGFSFSINLPGRYTTPARQAVFSRALGGGWLRSQSYGWTLSAVVVLLPGTARAEPNQRDPVGVKMLGRLIPRMTLPRNAQVAVKHPAGHTRHMPSVSVIIPCYNYGHYLPDCVASVLEQQGVRVDVLVIDDASPDGSSEVARRLAAQDARIHAICHEVNRGHIATYNEGLAQADGDYTVLLSADDLLTPGCLERATALMAENPSVGLVYGFPVNFTDSHLPPRTAATSWIVWHGHSWIDQMCGTGRNSVRSPEVVMRTRVLYRIGGLRPDLPHSGDLEMWLRAAAVSDVAYVGGADQAYYRVHANNMHNSFNLLADVYHRLRAFDIFLDENSGLLADAESLRRTVHRVLAREALGHAISAYARGTTESDLVTRLSAFALEAWPGSERLPEWRMLRRLGRMNDGRTRLEPRLFVREAVRNVAYSLAWWRRRWIGLN